MSINYAWFYNSVEERINQFGTQIGQEKKLLKAYDILAKALQSSMQNIFFMPSFRINEVPTQEDINTIAKTIMRFRGKVIHDGEKSSFSDDETPFVRFLEILVYSMILKRVGIPDEGIEVIIGVIFHCNYVAMENEVGHGSLQMTQLRRCSGMKIARLFMLFSGTFRKKDSSKMLMSEKYQAVLQQQQKGYWQK